MTTPTMPDEVFQPPSLPANEVLLLLALAEFDAMAAGHHGEQTGIALVRNRVQERAGFPSVEVR
ncbi:hypothetical protein BAY61_32130 (plasmid) [Prauserella marina]|uniref:Uncharacterized protein n=1 Tax=Prauserella marina TaxID=530584 RepID=A0A222W1W7_9PSEU|nr:hypothetical protein [Prauserella marina]ASR39933.1 hypothetical protein BAY61_32130 [Prauserella marina]PWV71435.1 hypothetical protein DES30_112151 [Prauserella marina]SDD97704.1 hypothetical protein SAMN05421630_115128 [Prauserella marina]